MDTIDTYRELDKRWRNTAASARFRLKKKQVQMETERQAREMTTKVTQLEKLNKGIYRLWFLLFGTGFKVVELWNIRIRNTDYIVYNQFIRIPKWDSILAIDHSWEGQIITIFTLPVYNTLHKYTTTTSKDWLANTRDIEHTITSSSITTTGHIVQSSRDQCLSTTYHELICDYSNHPT